MDIAVAAMLFLTGVAAYAAVNHLAVGLSRPPDPVHLLFAVLCTCQIGVGITQALSYQAVSVEAYLAALKWNVVFIMLFFMVFPWFVCCFTGRRARGWAIGASVAWSVLLVTHLFDPNTLQYVSINGLRTLTLPWGETVTLVDGRTGPGFVAAAAMVLASIVFALFVLVGSRRRSRILTTATMLAAMAVFLAAAFQAVLVRQGIVDFLNLGPYGFMVMVIAMSFALSQETRYRLLASERRFRALVDQSPFSIQVLARNGTTRQVNPAWKRLWGVTLDWLGGYNILADRQLEEKGVMPYIARAFAGQSAEIPPIKYNPAETTGFEGPERDRWIRAYAYPIKSDIGEVTDVILVHQDVTDRKRVEDAIRLIAAGVSSVTGGQFFRKLVANLARVFGAEYAFIGVLDEAGRQRVRTRAVWAGGRFLSNRSYTLPGTPCAEVVAHGSRVYEGAVKTRFPDDTRLAELGVEGYIGAPLLDARGGTLGVLAVMDVRRLRHGDQAREILEIFAARAGAEIQRESAEAEVRRLAYQDYLTRLANRAQFQIWLSEAIRKARASGGSGALILVDLDHFKNINDALGHDVGDELLRNVAQRIQDAAGPDARVARLGGDEFVALVDGADDTGQGIDERALAVAQRIVDKLGSTVYVGERALSVGASVGIATYPQDSESELDILRHADMALYRAKNAGRGIIRRYEPGLQAAAARRLHLEEGLRLAIGNGEFSLYFQPQVDAEHRIVGAECLLRWRHPELGHVPPATFIPVAEETGLIHAIGGWVLKTACTHLMGWGQQGLPFQGSLSVNVSPWQFARPDFVEQVSEVLDAAAIEPDRLMLEVTETGLLYDIQETAEKLRRLRAMGLKISLDDFGTGYSSLAYLRDLPLDQLKIDKGFVAELGSESENPLVESIIAIGQHMRLEVIAEGVETEAQRNILSGLGCRRFQGYHFGRPMPEDEFLAWTRRSR